jgi:selenocysteine-specific elongation factor
MWPAPRSGGWSTTDVPPEQHLILGTAGHIDHGKTQLTRALTGVDTDRLEEEKRRGISIVLGFAELKLPSGRTMGVVDVPGHERFIKNMVAGATGIDVVLLVVAADDGVMPQTREHLAIIDLLGVDNGVVAITKSDLADPEWIELVAEDIRSLLAGTSLEGAAIVAVSSKTGEGLDELARALDEAAARPAGRREELPLRLPVDRVFSMSGAGTVLTGTLWSGGIRPEDQVELMPGGVPARVRSVEVHGRKVEAATAGQRVAVNVTGIDREQVTRGRILASPGSLPSTLLVDARLRLLPSAPELKDHAPLHVHHGTAETTARVALLDRQVLAPGEACLVQLRLEHPLSPRYGDRFIVRSFSPVETIGGGVVLDATPRRHARLDELERRRLEALLAGDIPTALGALFSTTARPMTVGDIAARTQIQAGEVAAALAGMKGLARIAAGGEEFLIPEDARQELLDRIEQALTRHHDAQPASTGMDKQALRERTLAGAPPKLWDAVLAQAAAAGKAELAGNLVRHPKAAVSALAAEDETGRALLEYFAKAGVHPEDVKGVPAAAGVDAAIARKVLPKLTAAGSLVRVTPEMYFAAETIEDVKARLVEHLSGGGEITAAQFRDLIGSARKQAVPLLEYFDARGLTVRQGDVRRLKG